MTRQEAKQIKEWRMECSWRRVAELAYDAGIEGANWSPKDNQIEGRELCEMAGEILDEDCEDWYWGNFETA